MKIYRYNTSSKLKEDNGIDYVSHLYITIGRLTIHFGWNNNLKNAR